MCEEHSETLQIVYITVFNINRVFMRPRIYWLDTENCNKTNTGTRLDTKTFWLYYSGLYV